MQLFNHLIINGYKPCTINYLFVYLSVCELVSTHPNIISYTRSLIPFFQLIRSIWTHIGTPVPVLHKLLTEFVEFLVKLKEANVPGKNRIVTKSVYYSTYACIYSCSIISSIFVLICVNATICLVVDSTAKYSCMSLKEALSETQGSTKVSGKHTTVATVLCVSITQCNRITV